MTEEQWLVCAEPISMLNYMQDKAGERKFRLYACGCCRTVWSFLPAVSCRPAVAIGEAFADALVRAGEAEAAVVRTGASAGDYGAASRRRYRATAAGSVYPSAIVGAVIATRSSSRDARVRQRRYAGLIRDVFGNPFRPVSFDAAWRTDTAVTLARQMYESRDFGAMPILADALQDAGCDSDDILTHCRGPGRHVRGCWVCDLILGKE